MIASPAWAAIPSSSALRTEIESLSSPNFEGLLTRWSSSYGSDAATPLLDLARDKRQSDKVRYVALMGAAKLSGKTQASAIVPFLKDSSWMIRNGALRALTALEDPATAKAVLPLLKDPALVVRMEAIEAVKRLKPAGASQALVDTLRSQDNYRLGKAQWVPNRALEALAELKDPSIAHELRPLLDHRKDPELQKQTLATLEQLTGQKTDSTLPLIERIEKWKKNLAKN